MVKFDAADVEVASITDVGRKRETNQDDFGCVDLPSGARLLVVADGMGGHAGGATASRVAVETVTRSGATAEGAAPDRLRGALVQANREVYRASLEDSSLSGMGTTAVALLIEPDGAAWVAHVGDSRAYRLRGDGIEQLTEDHSVVAEMERRGMITAEEARVHPRRNEVLRSIGIDPDVEVDVVRVSVEPGDLLLLCSDGLSGVLEDSEIADGVRNQPLEAALAGLVERVNARGGPDNVTVQVARMPSSLARQEGVDSAPPPTPSPAGRSPAQWLMLTAAAGLAMLAVLWLVQVALA